MLFPAILFSALIFRKVWTFSINFGDNVKPLHPCYERRAEGTCDGQENAWYYDIVDNNCYFFIYSGCEGNGNRFSSKLSCEKSCKTTPGCPILDCPSLCFFENDIDGCPICSCSKDVAATVCKQKQARGFCRMLQYKWAYDPTTRICKRFIYGGCGGNDNNFYSENQCLLVCKQLDVKSTAEAEG